MTAPRLTIVGHYPPPTGGIATHVERLAAALAAEYDVRVFDLHPAVGSPAAPPGVFRLARRAPWALGALAARLRREAGAIAHVHVSVMRQFSWAGPLLLAVLPGATRKVLTLHGGGLAATYAALPAWRRALARWATGSFDAVVAVNAEQAAFLRDELGVDPGRLHLIPAYLPPPAGAADAALAGRLAALRQAREALLVVAGKGLPLYGFHTVVEALERRPALAEALGVVFALYDRVDPGYVEPLIARLGAVPHLVERDLPSAAFARVLAEGALFVRATDRDGDATSLREAAHAGLRVVASDCVPRPAGALTFATGDAEALAAALEAALADPALGRLAPEGPDTLDRLRAVYRGLRP